MKKFLSRSIATMILAGLAFTLSACNRQPPLDDNTSVTTKTTQTSNLTPTKGADTIYIVTNESQLVKLYKEQNTKAANIIQANVGIYPHDVYVDKDQHLHVTYNIENIGKKEIKAIHFTSFISLKFNNKDYHSPANLILAIPLKYDLSYQLTDMTFDPQTAIDLTVDYDLKDLFNHTDDVSAIEQYGIDNLSFANELNIISSVKFADGQTVYSLKRDDEVKDIATKHDSSSSGDDINSTKQSDKANLIDN